MLRSVAGLKRHSILRESSAQSLLSLRRSTAERSELLADRWSLHHSPAARVNRIKIFDRPAPQLRRSRRCRTDYARDWTSFPARVQTALNQQYAKAKKRTLT